MRRSMSVLLAFMLLLSCVFAVPVYAETVRKDGVEVTLTTDKESYGSLDMIDAKLVVKNTNSFDMENVSMEIQVPDGYMLTSDGEAKIDELSAGEVQWQQTSMRDAKAPLPVLPQTGDDSHAMLWGLLFMLSSAAVCALVIRNPHAKRIISLFLCLAMITPYLTEVAPVVAAENTVENRITVEKEISVDGDPVVLTGVVTYETSPARAYALARNVVAAPAEDFYYVEENGKITLCAYNGNDENLVIPAEINGMPVTVVGVGNRASFSYLDFLEDPSMLKTLVFPDTVKKITAEAFAECSNLTSIQFPYGSLEYIGGAAFAGCTSLTEISIYSAGDLGVSSVSVTQLDGWEDGGAFARCEKLKKVDIVSDGDLTIGKSAFANSFQVTQDGNTVNLQAKDSLVIRERAFENCKRLFEVEMNAGADSQIGNFAFSSCESICEMTIPLQTTEIGDGAFQGTESLVNLTIMPTVESIGVSAFSRLGLIGEPLMIYGHKGSYIETYVAEHNKTNEGNRQIVFVTIECDHSSDNHRSERDSNSVTRYRLSPNDESSHANGHQTGDIYTRYCKDCGMVETTDILIWSDILQAHQMVDGACSQCGYENESKRIQITSHSNGDTVTVGDTVTIKWKKPADYNLSNYFWELYLLDGEPTYSGNESGKLVGNYEFPGMDSQAITIPVSYSGKWLMFKVFVATYNDVLLADPTYLYLKVNEYDMPQVKFTSHDVLSEIYLGDTTTIEWVKDEFTYYSIINMKILDGEPAYTENEAGTSWIENESKFGSSFTIRPQKEWVGKWIKFHVYGVTQSGNFQTAKGNAVYIKVLEESDCQHTAYTDYENGKIQYTEKDATSHYYQLGYDRDCNNCDAVWQVYSDMSEDAIAPHDFSNDDVCLCGYDRSNCQHLPTQGMTVYKEHIFEEIAGNNEFHRVAGVIYNETCSQCQQVYEVEVRSGLDEGAGKEFPYEQKHAMWENGVCGVCGYECHHVYEYIVDEKNNYVPVTGSEKWEKQDEIYHVCTEIKYQMECSFCSLKGESEYVPAGWTKEHEFVHLAGGVERNEKQHRFFDDQVCSLEACGARPTIGEWEDHYEYEVVKRPVYDTEGEWHTIWNELLYYCKCGQLVAWGGREYVDWDQHEDLNRDEKCDLCGESWISSKETDEFNPDSSDYIGIGRLTDSTYTPLYKVNEYGTLYWLWLSMGKTVDNISEYTSGRIAEFVMEYGPAWFVEKMYGEKALYLAENVEEEFKISAYKERMHLHISTMLDQNQEQKMMESFLEDHLGEPTADKVEYVIEEMTGEFFEDLIAVGYEDATDMAGFFFGLADNYEKNIEYLELFEESIQSNSYSEEDKKPILKAITQLKNEYSHVVQFSKGVGEKLVGTAIDAGLNYATLGVFEIIDSVAGIVASGEGYDKSAAVVYDTMIETNIMAGKMVNVELAIQNGKYVSQEEFDEYLTCAEYVYVSRIGQCKEYGWSDEAIDELIKGLEVVLQKQGHSQSEIDEYIERVK